MGDVLASSKRSRKSTGLCIDQEGHQRVLAKPATTHQRP
jgi:hypothetical protein